MAISGRELRIGNLVWYEATAHIVRGTVGGMIYSNWLNSPDEQPLYFGPADQHEPIELSEEWLLRAGFEILFPEGKVLGASYNILFTTPGMCIEISHNKEENCWNFSNWFPSKVNVHYVHQLQNIINVLTGQELQFKDIPQ